MSSPVFSGTFAELLQACKDTPDCMTIEYDVETRAGVLCAHGFSPPPLPTFTGNTTLGCFEAPLCAHSAPRVTSGEFDTLEEAGRACLAEPLCGAVQSNTRTGIFTLHSAWGVTPDAQAGGLWKVGQLCAQFQWLCADANEGKVRMVRGDAAKRGVAV